MTKRTVTVDERNQVMFADQCEASDVESVVKILRTQHNCKEAVVFDRRTCHLGYWDKSTRTVDTGALERLQRAGYRIIYAGAKTVNGSTKQRAWIEARLHDPRDVVGGE